MSKHIPNKMPDSELNCESAIAQERIRALEDKLDFEKNELDDLRHRLDSEAAERIRLTSLITKPKTPWILYIIGASTLTAAVLSILHAIKS